MNDPFVAAGLFVIDLAAIMIPLFIWLFPIPDRALGRLSDYIDARKAR